MAIIPLSGDRSAWDMDYETLHASDISSGSPRYHTPEPEAGTFLYSADGNVWEKIDIASLALLLEAHYTKTIDVADDVVIGEAVVMDLLSINVSDGAIIGEIVDMSWLVVGQQDDIVLGESISISVV